MSDVDAVCSDLDSTLCVPNQSDAEIHRQVFDQVGIDPIFTPADIRAVDAAEIETVLERLTADGFDDAFKGVFEQQTISEEDVGTAVDFLRDQRRYLDSHS